MAAGAEVKKPWGILNSLTEGVESVLLVEDEVFIGKAEVKSTSRNISRRHFKILRKGEGTFFIEDYSTNGTYVNNERIRKGELVKIKDGVDVIILNQHHPDSIRFMFMSYDDGEDPDFMEFCKKYEYGKYLGEGAYAAVRVVTEKATGQQYAMKIINKVGQKTSSKRIDAQYDEVKVLSSVKGGDLFTRIIEHGSFSEKNARYVVRNILTGIEYLHSKGIAHRDLKPENIMMVDDDSIDIKIADFGLSRMVDDGSFMSTLCGTPNYVAPEVIQHKGYTSSVDIWSIGVITYALLSSKLPFYSSKKDGLGSLYAKIIKGEFEFGDKGVWDAVSQEGKDFIRCLLNTDPGKRPTAAEALKHPWFALELDDENTIDDTEANPPPEKKVCPDEIASATI